MIAEGIVRLARRPPGWRAPGPPPAAPRERLDLWPRVDEDLCCLSGDWRILQRLRGHRWSLDDLLTAWVAAESMAAPPGRIADLGCGIGAVLLMLAWRFPSAHVAGIEAQAESAALARRSIAWNGAEDRCEVRVGDLRQAMIAADECFDLVSGTPPYLPPGTACEPSRSLQLGCHLELRGGIEAYCEAAARLLAPDGRFAVCHSSVERTERAASAAGLSIAASLAVIPRAGKAPLFWVFTMRRGDSSEAQAVERAAPAAHAMRSIAENVAKSGRRSATPCAAGAARSLFSAHLGAAAAPAEIVVRRADGQWSDEFRAVRRAMGMPDRPPQVG